MFIVVFLIMLPIYLTTKDAIRAWEAGVAWAFIIGVIVLIGAFVGPIHPQVRAPGGDAWHPGRHLHHLHLDAAGGPDVGHAWDRVCRCSRSSWSASGRCPAAVQLPDRPGRPAGRHRHRLDRRVHVGARRHLGRQGHRHRHPHPPARPADQRPQGHRPAAGHGHPVGRLQLHRGHDQRRERRGGGRQLQPAQRAAGRRRRRHRRLCPRLALPAGRVHRPPRLEGRRRSNRVLDSPPASSSRCSASWVCSG